MTKPTRTFQGISPEVFTALLKRLNDVHDAHTSVSRDGLSGQVAQGDVTVNYTRDLAAETVTVSIERHPWYIPEAAIFHMLQDKLDAVEESITVPQEPETKPQPTLTVQPSGDNLPTPEYKGTKAKKG